MIETGKDITCYGCGVCVVSCPKGILRMDLSDNGFYVPFVDDIQACIECGLCEKVCSYLDNDVFNIRRDNIKAYAAYNKVDCVRRESTSGGVGIEIAGELNKVGYDLCGVEYDSESRIAKHFIANDINEYQKSKGSKYIQSYTVDAFSSFEKGKKYVVFGSPCQIDSLRRYVNIKKWDSDFFFVDFFCHGVPSYNLWTKYLEHLNNMIHISDNTRISFRDKQYGWHSFTVGVYGDNEIMYSSLSSNDLFLSMFLGNYCLNSPCYDCKFRLANSSADMRIGDLWGKKYSNDNKGISGLLSITNKGDKLVNKLRDNCFIVEEEFSTVVEGQMKGNYPHPRKYDRIMKSLQSELPLKVIYRRFGFVMIVKNLIPIKLKIIIKKFLNR
jgi:coenzyme F420-reducing hydrogenase beta subunit